MTSVLVYTGFLLTLAGLLSILKPLVFLRIKSRRAGAAVLLIGFGLGVLGAAWPAGLHHSEGRHTRIDDFMPAYNFHEIHSTRIHASPDQVFRAIKAVTPQEIRFFHTLMWIRALPERFLADRRLRPLMPGYSVASHETKALDAHEFVIEGATGKTKRVEGEKTQILFGLDEAKSPAVTQDTLQTYEHAIEKMGGSVVSREGCCKSTLKLGRAGAEVWVEIVAPESGKEYQLTIVQEGDTREAEAHPILDLFARSGFLVLAEERDRELVLGTVNQFWRLAGGGSPRILAEPRQFLAFEDPGYAKVTANFSVEDQGNGWSRLTTETRILGTDPSARRAFGVYWRVIYPGSAIIRRMWLRAIKQRAQESG